MSGSAERISACAPAHPTDDQSEHVDPTDPTEVEGTDELDGETLFRLRIAYSVAGAALEAAGGSVYGDAPAHSAYLVGAGQHMQRFAEGLGHRAEFLLPESPHRETAIAIGLEVES